MELDRSDKITGNPIGAPQISRDAELWRTELSESGLFGDIRLSAYPWSRDYGVEEYRGLYRTYSDFKGLGAELREKTAGLCRSFSEHGLLGGTQGLVLPVHATQPTTGAAHALLEFGAYPFNVLPSRFGLLHGDDPADPLVSGKLGKSFP